MGSQEAKMEREVQSVEQYLRKVGWLVSMNERTDEDVLRRMFQFCHYLPH